MCQGWVSTLARHSHPVQASQANCCRAGGQWEAPWVTQGPVGHQPAPSPLPPSRTSLLLFLALALTSSSRRGIQHCDFLPSAAGMQEGEGGEPPAEQLKITKYFPNIIRFPCKQLP